jgi:hypothetical protein
LKLAAVEREVAASEIMCEALRRYLEIRTRKPYLPHYTRICILSRCDERGLLGRLFPRNAESFPRRRAAASWLPAAASPRRGSSLMTTGRCQPWAPASTSCAFTRLSSTGFSTWSNSRRRSTYCTLFRRRNDAHPNGTLTLHGSDTRSSSRGVLARTIDSEVGNEDQVHSLQRKRVLRPRLWC